MEAALLAILTQLGLALGEDVAGFLSVFIGGFLTLRFQAGGKGLILPQLVHWWMVAADTQKHGDGTPYTSAEKHAYVLGIIDSWAKGIGLDLASSFKDALINNIRHRERLALTSDNGHDDFIKGEEQHEENQKR